MIDEDEVIISCKVLHSVNQVLSLFVLLLKPLLLLLFIIAIILLFEISAFPKCILAFLTFLV